ncbi:MAG: nucleotide exchange factor GrpE [Nitrospirota bacterium]
MEELDKKNSVPAEDKNAGEISAPEHEVSEQEKADEKSAIQELNDKHLRLYAEFENYKKRVNKEKEELIKYGNESLLYDLLPVIDNLELALKHASEDSNTGLVQGVEITLKELHRTLEKFGLSRIDSVGKVFDPSIHHAMMQVEKDDIDEKIVVEELRAGYVFRDKLLRPSFVAVSVKPQNKAEDNANDSENIKIRIEKETEEE